MSTSVHASITETNYQLLRKIYDASLDTKAAVQAIADSEARAVSAALAEDYKESKAVEDERDQLRTAYDVCAKTRTAVISERDKLKAERNQLRAEVRELERQAELRKVLVAELHSKEARAEKAETDMLRRKTKAASLIKRKGLTKAKQYKTK